METTEECYIVADCVGRILHRRDIAEALAILQMNLVQIMKQVPADQQPKTIQVLNEGIRVGLQTLDDTTGPN